VNIRSAYLVSNTVGEQKFAARQIEKVVLFARTRNIEHEKQFNFLNNLIIAIWIGTNLCEMIQIRPLVSSYMFRCFYFALQPSALKIPIYTRKCAMCLTK
jgi:hypothetical protein